MRRALSLFLLLQTLPALAGDVCGAQSCHNPHEMILSCEGKSVTSASVSCKPRQSRRQNRCEALFDGTRIVRDYDQDAESGIRDHYARFISFVSAQIGDCDS